MEKQQAYADLFLFLIASPFSFFTFQTIFKDHYLIHWFNNLFKHFLEISTLDQIRPCILEGGSTIIEEANMIAEEIVGKFVV